MEHLSAVNGLTRPTADSGLKLFLLPLSEVALLPEEKLRASFPKRFERAMQFRQREDMLRCLGGAALLRGVMNTDEDGIAVDENGKPYLVGGTPFFSLSHSGEYILLAAGESELGADVERIDPRHLSLAPRIFTPEELRWQSESPEERFYLLWTLKESATKQLGLGFRVRPESFSVLPLIGGDSIELLGQRLYGGSVLTDGHVLSVCAPHPVGPLMPRVLRAAELCL